MSGGLDSSLVTALARAEQPNRMDKDAMGCSVETRLPLLDPSEVRLALNLPLEARTYPRLKGILRDVGRRHLPPDVAKRPKHPGMTFDAQRRIEEAARPPFLQDGLLRELLGCPLPALARADGVSLVARRLPPLDR